MNALCFVLLLNLTFINCSSLGRHHPKSHELLGSLKPLKQVCKSDFVCQVRPGFISWLYGSCFGGFSFISLSTVGQ